MQKGHLITEWYNDTPSSRSKFCDKCGEETITKCLECGENIRGHHVFPNITEIGFEFDIPNCCHNCGANYPWTSKVLENAVELVALDENLSDEHKEIIKNTFPDLLIETPTTPVATAKYKKYISKSEGFTQDGLRQLFIDLVSDIVRKSIWS